MGPTWVLSAPEGAHVGPLNLAQSIKYGACSNIQQGKQKVCNIWTWYVLISYISDRYIHNIITKTRDYKLINGGLSHILLVKYKLLPNIRTFIKNNIAV